MKKKIRLMLGVAAGALASLVLTSCYYDPNYGSTSVGASYSSGYGQGYGYGGSNFSTSVFVSTGDPQWGYDPNCYSYYDYRRRAYYDPYLNGYYPVGYRPPVVYGVPHPYGWHQGGGHIRPPVRVSNVTIQNYQNRSDRYRSTNYGWAKQVRQQPANKGRVVNSHSSSQSNGYNRANSSTAKPQQSNSSRSKQDSRSSTRQSTNTQGRQQSGSLPSRYNTPVRTSDSQAKKSGGNKSQQSQSSRQKGQRTESSRSPDSRDSGKGKKNSDSDNKNRSSRYR